jgi:hypothetical protein
VADDESPSERDAHFGPGGPAEAAVGWLRDLVSRRDLRGAWRVTDPEYRLALTQAIIFLNDQHPALSGLSDAGRDQLAEALSQEDPHHPLWDAFAGLLSEEFLQDLGEIRLDHIEAATPRPVAPEYELVLFAHANLMSDPDEPVELHAHGVLMHLRDERWMVAGLSERKAVPGWPPDLGY